MATMYGADVAQLRQLASQFDAKAQALDADRMSVGNAIQISAWVGPVAVRFRHTWESDYSRKLHDAASRLRDAAIKLRANADDQERTSAVDGGAGAGRSGGTDPGGVDLPSIDELGEAGKDLIKIANTYFGTITDAKDLVDALRSGTIEYKSFLEWTKQVKGLDAMTVLSLFGMGVSANELGQAIGNDDPAATLEASLDLVMGAVGVKVPAAGLAWELGTFLGEGGYNTLQTFYDSPSSALDFATRTIYGDEATFDSLEPWQRDIIMDRYDGLQGLLISNVDHVGGAVADFWTWVTTGKGRGAHR